VVATEEVGIVRERVQYYGPNGRLITESIKDFTRKMVRQEFTSLDAFLKRWTEVEKKQEILRELEERGVLLEALAEEVGKDFDSFDLICHVAFDQPPLSRKERADQVRKRDYFTKYGEQVRAVLEALLSKYADEGIENIEDINVLKVDPLKQLGTPIEIIKLFGNRQAYTQAVQEMTAELYKIA
jgi:type I restriction enzyme R subunit